MKKFAALSVIPLFAGFLCAQDPTETTTTTKTTTYNGTLIDAGCRTTHTVHKESHTNPDSSITTKTERSTTTDCPATMTTSSFGLLTSDGKFVRFDDPSNTKIVEIVKTNKTWSKELNDRAPIKVRVVGTPHGDVVVMESIR
jgi:hypothetical protein